MIRPGTIRNGRQPGAELVSFGRRRGRKMSPRQQSLLATGYPAVAIDPAQPAPAHPAALFAPGTGKVWLEIGFGGGEHLVWQAAQNPDAGIIGCEPFQDGVVKVLDAIEQRGLANIRLYADDGRTVLRWLPPGSIARAFVLFPDPWPKARHQKRRLLSPATFALFARVLEPGAELRIATDIPGYARAILLAAATEPALDWIATRPADWRDRPADWPQTRYESKALAAGRRCCYLRFRRR